MQEVCVVCGREAKVGPVGRVLMGDIPADYVQTLFCQCVNCGYYYFDSDFTKDIYGRYCEVLADVMCLNKHMRGTDEDSVYVLKTKDDVVKLMTIYERTDNISDSIDMFLGALYSLGINPLSQALTYDTSKPASAILKPIYPFMAGLETVYELSNLFTIMHAEGLITPDKNNSDTVFLLTEAGYRRQNGD